MMFCMLCAVALCCALLCCSSESFFSASALALLALSASCCALLALAFASSLCLERSSTCCFREDTSEVRALVLPPAAGWLFRSAKYPHRSVATASTAITTYMAAFLAVLGSRIGKSSGGIGTRAFCILLSTSARKALASATLLTSKEYMSLLASSVLSGS